MGIASALAILVGSCAPSPSASGGQAGPVSPLVVLVASDAWSSIAIHAPGGRALEVAAPAGSVQWLAADAAGRLLATLSDGSLVRTAGPAATHPAWEPVPRRRPPAGGEPPLSFAVPGPAGAPVAGLLATYGSGIPSSLALLSSGGDVRVVDLALEANGSAPAWISPTTVAVAGLRPDGTAGTDIVDVATDRVTAGPRDLRAVAVSGDGSRIASVAVDQRTVTVTSTEAWLRAAAASATSGAMDASPRAGATSPAPAGSSLAGPAILPQEPDGVVTALALDATGRSLAVVWTDRDLVPVAVVRYEDAGGWRTTERIALQAGVTRAAVAWLPDATALADATPPWRVLPTRAGTAVMPSPPSRGRPRRASVLSPRTEGAPSGAAPREAPTR